MLDSPAVSPTSSPLKPNRRGASGGFRLRQAACPLPHALPPKVGLPPINRQTTRPGTLLLSGILAALVLGAGWWPGTTLAEEPGVRFGSRSQPMRVVWVHREIRALVYPLPNEGYHHIVRRVLRDPSMVDQVIALNRNNPVQPERPVHIPLGWLTPSLIGQALRAIYPEDDLTEKGWEHRVSDPLESLTQLTLIYTGSLDKMASLARFNRLKDPDRLRLGEVVTIPLRWIPPELGFQPQVKPPLKLDAAPQDGRFFAVYTLRPDETLYSSVILRFTDRERADEVNRLAKKLLKLNGLKNSQAVRAGTSLRIPLEWLSEEYLTQAPSVSKPPPFIPPPIIPPSPPGRRGRLHVIVDPGHGGVDTGAVYGSVKKGDRVYEDDMVYDIALRLRLILEKNGHKVYLTLKDPDTPAPVSRLSPQPDKDEMVLVNPPYKVDKVDIGVNMRVYLIESIYRKLRKQGVRSTDILLISIHGDALTPSMRGAMVYYPDHRLRHQDFGPQGRVYRLRSEAVPASIRFNEPDNRHAGGLGGQFAQMVVKGLQKAKGAVTGRKPVRSYYYRKGKRTLPAVLRYSRVPTSVLVEVANLNNIHDRRALLLANTRQQIAGGLALAVQMHQQSNRKPKAILASDRRPSP